MFVKPFSYNNPPMFFELINCFSMIDGHIDSPPTFNNASIEGFPNLAFNDTQNFTPFQVMLVVI